MITKLFTPSRAFAEETTNHTRRIRGLRGRYTHIMMKCATPQKRDIIRLPLLSFFLALATVARILLTLDQLSTGSTTFDDAEVLVASGRPELFSSISTTNEYDHGDQLQCSVYLAPSSVADGNTNRPAGFGIYTTRSISKGEYVFPRGTGPVVPITDIKANNIGNKPSFANSIFMPKCIGMGIESGDEQKGTTYPKYKGSTCYKSNNNCGSLTNFHPMLINLMVDDTDNYQDNLLSRYTDPGAGAFSYQMGERWHTTRHVEAGEELFNDYGETWFFDGILNGRESIPHREHYLKAAKVISLFTNSYNGDDEKEVIGQKELDEFREEVSHADYVDQLTKRLIDLAIPNVDAFSKLIESSRTYANRSTDYSNQFRLQRSIGIQSTMHRDVDWIRTNGRCLDNVYPKQSTLPQAGQGGFAARRLEKGQVIVPVPTMVQVTDREELNVYKHRYINGEAYTGARRRLHWSGAPYTKQLLLNYCFGHDDSSMLLCPATNANLINHCSTRTTEQKMGQCDPDKGPNAILRWATEFDPETSEWLTQDLNTVKERIKDGRRGLSLEIVALRDIGVNEEIFIDYGPTWEDAWKRHVAAWKLPSSSDNDDGNNFVPVSDMNLNVEKYLLAKAELDGGKRSYPHKNVRIGCYVGGYYHPCEIIEKNNWIARKAFGAVYSVNIRRWKGEGESNGDFSYNWPFRGDNEVVKLMSADIKFFAGPYSSDQHLVGTFRHSIGVPHGMWPQKWINNATIGNHA